MTTMNQSKVANYRFGELKPFVTFFSWTLVTHVYFGDEGESIVDVASFDDLCEDACQSLRLSRQDLDELVDLGMLGITADTHGQCFGFDVNTEEMTPLKAKVLRNSIQAIIDSKESDQ